MCSSRKFIANSERWTSKLQIQMVTHRLGGWLILLVYILFLNGATHTHTDATNTLFIINIIRGYNRKKIVLFAFCYWNNNVLSVCFIFSTLVSFVLRAISVASRTSLYTHIHSFTLYANLCAMHTHSTAQTRTWLNLNAIFVCVCVCTARLS